MSMSTLAVVYIGTDSAYPFEPFFGGRSAFERCLDWLHSLSCVSRVLVCTDSGAAAPERAAYIAEAAERAACEASEKTYERRTLETPCTAALLAAAARAAKDCGAERVLFALGNCPFYDAALTQELLETHSRYAAEYTFADCYPLGFAPEVLDTGALGILARFAQGGEGIPQAAADAGRKSISFDSIFGVIKTDVNSFEIETVLSPLDMRLYRLEFSCACKRTALSCRALYEAAEKRHDFSPLALCRAARETPAVLRTVPSFYYIQIAVPCTGTCTFCPYPAACGKKYGCQPAAIQGADAYMPYERFEEIIDAAQELSEQAVISLSLWGEALLHPDIARCMSAVLKKPGLSLCIETDGVNAGGELIDSIRRELSGIDWQNRLFWIVSCDAADAETYAKLHGCESGVFAVVQRSIELLEQAFPGCVYEQFVRMNENEQELERFYRYWKEHGRALIQKYDNFCGLLADKKTADLAPAERKPCWHLRRDMHILADGTVPLCRERVLDSSLGCVFSESLETIWQRAAADETADPLCRTCDEYYTFNF